MKVAHIHDEQYKCSVAMRSEIGSSLRSNNNLWSDGNMEGDTVAFIDQGV